MNVCSIVLSPCSATFGASKESGLAFISTSKLSQPPVSSIVATFFASYTCRGKPDFLVSFQYGNFMCSLSGSCNNLLFGVHWYFCSALSAFEHTTCWKHHTFASWAKLHYIVKPLKSLKLRFFCYLLCKQLFYSLLVLKLVYVFGCGEKKPQDFTRLPPAHNASSK